MKNLFVVVSFICGVLCSLSFLSCSTDEKEDPTQSKIQLLLNKSKEFSTKYGIDMQLNPDSIGKAVDTLTVEKMEEDYKRMANFKVKMEGTELPTKVKTRNKLRLNVTSTNYEETNFSGEFRFTSIDTQINGKCSYSIGNHGSGTAHVTIEERGGMQPSGTFPITGATEYASKDGYVFSVSGTIVATVGVYRTIYFVDIIHNKQNTSVYISVKYL